MSANEQPLFDAVESNELVIFTGAGFSSDFRGRDGKPLPGWKDLLKKVRSGLERKHADFTTLSGQPADQLLDTFFAEESPRGEHLIEAATILRRSNPRSFRQLIERCLTPADPQPLKLMKAYEEKHRAIMSLEPRAIVTVNVDRFHERFVRKHARGWTVHDPVNDGAHAATEVVKCMRDRRFLIKAHGTIGKKIVFDYDAYRDLIEKTPSYTALFSHLFSHYRMLFVGFGLSDLDFDMLIDTAVRRFGSPLQQHVTLQLKPPRPRSRADRIKAAMTAARAARLGERFGIQTLEVERHEIVPLLDRASRMPGTRLQEVIRRCASRDFEERRRAHRDLAALGTVGKRVAMRVMYEQVRDALTAATGPLRKRELHDLSEWTYSLGYVNPSREDDRRTLASNLMDIVERTSETEIVAHALLALVSLVRSADIRRLKRIRASGHVEPDRLTNHPHFRADPARCRAYLDALIARALAEKA